MAGTETQKSGELAAEGQLRHLLPRPSMDGVSLVGSVSGP